MTKTVEGLLNHCKVALAQNWKYVYGAKGTVLTRTQIQSLKNRYGSLVWNSDLNKAGSICCDCSGLISSYTGVIRSSSSYKSTATAIATTANIIYFLSNPDTNNIHNKAVINAIAVP